MARDNHDELQVEKHAVMREVTKVDVQSVKQNKLCTVRRPTIGLNRSRAVRPRTGSGSKRLGPVPPRAGRRLERNENMLRYLQNKLGDIEANQDADEPNNDQGQHKGVASTRGSTPGKSRLKRRRTA